MPVSRTSQAPFEMALQYSHSGASCAQVHEKSILLPLMPVMLLAPEQPVLSRWLPPVACFSMYPLLKKDGLTLAYIAMMMLWGAVCWPDDNREEEKEQAKATKAQAKPTKAHGRRKGKQRQEGNRLLMLTLGASAVLAVGVHAAGWTLDPPERYPYIFDAMITSLSFVHILGMAAYLQLQFLSRDHAKQRQD
jgi:alpha-1,3-glucosyltransferase